MKKKLLIYLVLFIVFIVLAIIFIKKKTSGSAVDQDQSKIVEASIIDIVDPLDGIETLRTPEPTPNPTIAPSQPPTKEPKEVKVKKNKNKKKKAKKKKVKKNIQTFKITAYCPCARCCGKCTGKTSTGTTANEGRTIAVDPKTIPYGTHVKFNGHEYIAEDCGGAIKGNRIDLYFDSHSEALDWGVRYIDVEILPKKNKGE